MCTTDLCNDLEYDLHTERATRLFLNQTGQQQQQQQQSSLGGNSNQGLFDSPLSSLNHSLSSFEEVGQEFYDEDEYYSYEEVEKALRAAEEEVEDEDEEEEEGQKDVAAEVKEEVTALPTVAATTTEATTASDGDEDEVRAKEIIQLLARTPRQLGKT